jgi:hypothetical protein
MNTVLIVFLVFVIILAIYLAVQFYNPSYLIPKSEKLNILNSATPRNSTQSVIKVESIDNTGSGRYFYEGWFFINTNAPIHTANVLYNRGKDFVVALTGSTLNLYINAPADRVNAGGILDTSGLTPLISVQNFPFQKWCQLVINVDGNVVDLYIDGKFVQNVKSPTPIKTSTTDTITYGNQYTVGHVARFRRPAESINPQGVWASYMNGSGQDYSVTSYHLNAQITKNKRVTTDQRLF